MKKKNGNRTIAQKIRRSIVMIAVACCLMIGMIGVIGIAVINRQSQNSYRRDQQPLQPIYEVQTDLQAIQSKLKSLALESVTNSGSQNDYANGIETRRKDMEKQLNAYGKCVVGDRNRRNFQTVRTGILDYEKSIDGVEALISEGKPGEAAKTIAQNTAAVEKLESQINGAFTMNNTQARQSNQQSGIVFLISIAGILVFAAVFIGIAFKMANRISTVIGVPIRKMVKAAESVADGNLDVDLTVDSDDETGILAESLRKIVQSLNRMKADIQTMIRKAQEGDLNSRVDASRHKGDYRTIIAGVNQMFDTVKEPLDQASGFITGLAAGTADEPIRNTYKGYYAKLIDNLNSVLDSLHRLMQESAALAAAGQKGDLSFRGDIHKVPGHYAEVVAGMNRIFDTVSTPLGEIERVMKNASDNNDFTVKITGQYQGMFQLLADSVNQVLNRFNDTELLFGKIAGGDLSMLEHYQKIGKRSEHDRLIPASIAMMQTIRNMIAEVNRLAAAASAGDIAQRGDDTQFQGGYRQVIRGFNRTVQAVVTPLQEAMQVLATLSHGDLTAEMSGSYQGGFDELKKTINQVGASLNGVLSELDLAAQQVSAGSSQVAAASQSLAQGASEQASSVEELTATVTQIAAQTKEAAKEASQASSLSSETRRQAADGKGKMDDMLTAMKEINKSSSDISKIVKVIDDIAAQTNILALNAAVEAARAGKAGQGFAVVAQEVRNLASQSAKAANETTSLIEGSIAKVGSGTKIANETAEKLTQILESTEKTADLVQTIASTAGEQANAISQVDQGINQVSAVIQSNSAAAEESATSSEELSSQAEVLTQIVGRFQLKKEDASPAADAAQ